MSKCYHYNFVGIFNSDKGCAYCPACGKAPLSYEECAISILKPGTDSVALAIAKDILATCLDPKCDICIAVRREYPHLK